MRKLSESIIEKLNHGDWVSIVVLYENFNKQLEKTRRIGASARVPKFYYRTLGTLEENIIVAHENNVAKSMSSSNAKAFTSLRQRLKKYLKHIDSEMCQFRTSPDSSEEELHSEALSRTEKNLEREASEKKVDFFKADAKDISFEMVDEKMKEIVLLRGKKGTNRSEAVEMLTKLISYAKCIPQEVEILMNTVSAQFDIAGSMAVHMAVPVWKDCVKNVLRIVALLRDSPQISLADHTDVDGRPSGDEIIKGAPIIFQGSICGYTERLDDEFFKSLQCIDPHSKEYVSRLKDESLLLALIDNVMKFSQGSDDISSVVKMNLRYLEHVYYKPDEVYETICSLIPSESQLPLSQEESVVSNYCKSNEPHKSKRTMKIYALTSFLLKHGDERARARAILCEIFNEASVGNFSNAHDKLLMSQLQGSISHADISTQILFNRTMAQLGISAFCKGHFSASHACLNELFSGGKVRELLAQGLNLNRFHDRTIEQEKIEKRRQLPFHMHLNLELLESIFLVCCIFIEVPKLTGSKIYLGRIHSKSFTRLIDIYEQQTFNGPAENVRETLMSATSSLVIGDWRQAMKLILSLESWKFLSLNKDDALNYVIQRLKEEGLRIFLLQYAAQYASASFQVLSEMFELSFSSVYSVICSMISCDNLLGSCDLSSRCILVTHEDLNSLQEICTSFVDKLSYMNESNDLALNSHLGANIVEYQQEEEYAVSRSRRYSRNFPLDSDESNAKVGRGKQRGMSKFSRSSVDISSEGNYRGKARNLKATEFAQRSGKFAQRKREDYHDRSDRLVPLFSSTSTNLLWQHK